MRNYDDPVYKEVRKKVLKRDGHCCQMPDCESKKKLHVHHIIRFDPSNLITLCKKCHESIKDMEHIYQSIFMRIVRDNENNS
jgi:5-methylcytosine-specific restriction endonuclease McrA